MRFRLHHAAVAFVLCLLASVAAAAVKPEIALEDETEVDFEDTALVDACRFLSMLHDAKIVLDPGVDGQAPVTLKESGVKVKTVLRKILKPHGLIYVVRGDRIVIRKAPR